MYLFIIIFRTEISNLQICNLCYILQVKNVLLLMKYIFLILRRDSTVKSTNVLKQSFNIKYYIILNFFFMLLEKATSIIFIFVHRPQF